MARCATTKLLLFAVPLLGAGDEMTGDDEASVVPLTVGHAASHVIRPKRIYFPEDFCYCFFSNLCVLNTSNKD
jgi:hypothetical protein